MEDGRLRAAIRGAVGVVPNSDVGGAGVEFLELVTMGLRCPRRSTWMKVWVPQCRGTRRGRCLGHRVVEVVGEPMMS